MKSVQVKIANQNLLHVNTVRKITEVAGQFANCHIYVINGTNKADAKSIISLMAVWGSLKLPTKVEIAAEGDNEGGAVEAIAKIFNK